MGIDSDALIALLPHRPPFRFVAAVDALEPGISVQGRMGQSSPIKIRSEDALSNRVLMYS